MMTALCGLIPFAASAETFVDFSKIDHWTGEGENRAALVIRFEDADEAYVWGYRWKDGNPTGEDMFRAVCGNSTELCLLTQYTGAYGRTVAGVGMSDGQKLLDCLTFDFAEASRSSSISFGYYEPATFMGQTSAPGDETSALCRAAIDQASEDTHVIDHPLDSETYGYPAYDYDFWILDTSSESYSDAYRWNAGWNEGYWSYWSASSADDEYGYSGVGFSDTELTDGCVDGWRYNCMSGIGAGTPPNESAEDLSYRPVTTQVDFKTSVESIGSETLSRQDAVYSLSGVKLADSADMTGLPEGIYIVINDGEIAKRVVR